jgi:hypothetical protein
LVCQFVQLVPLTCGLACSSDHGHWNPSPPTL